MKMIEWISKSSWFFMIYTMASYLGAQWIQKKFNLNSITDYHFPFEKDLFLPESIWIYLSGYIIPIAAVWVGKKEMLKFLTIPSLISQTIALAIFIAIPTACTRESFPTLEMEGLSASLLEAFRQIDDHSNSFPSTHVNFASLSTLWIYHANRKWFPFFLVWGLGIISSTLLVKQHYLIDIMGGIALSTICYSLIWIYHATQRVSTEEIEIK